MILGKTIEAYRQKYKLSRRSLAKNIGIDHVTLMRLEQDDSHAISVDVLGKIYHWQLQQHLSK